MTKRKPESEKMKAGRHTKYKPEVHLSLAKLCAKAGFLDYEIAQALEIDLRNLYRWKAKYPEFRQAISEGKDMADERVEASLYKKAIGYKEKVIETHKGIVNGKKVDKEVEKTVEYPPDAGAAKFILCNRHPEKWKEKQSVEIEANDLNVNIKITGE